MITQDTKREGLGELTGNEGLPEYSFTLGYAILGTFCETGDAM